MQAAIDCGARLQGVHALFESKEDAFAFVALMAEEGKYLPLPVQHKEMKRQYVERGDGKWMPSTVQCTTWDVVVAGF